MLCCAVLRRSACCTFADASSAESRVDAGVQADLGPSGPLLPPDSSAPPPELLSAVAAPLAAAAGKDLRQPLQQHREAAAVLAGLTAWLPREVLNAAAAAAGGGGAEGADGGASAAAEGGEGGAAAAAGAGAAGGLGGVSLWREEARLAESVVELVAQLEESWGGLMDTLEQEQVGVPLCGGCWMGGGGASGWGALGREWMGSQGWDEEGAGKGRGMECGKILEHAQLSAAGARMAKHVNSEVGGRQREAHRCVGWRHVCSLVLAEVLGRHVLPHCTPAVPSISQTKLWCP